MDTHQERLSRLNHALLSGKDVCSSEGMLRDFPESLKKPFQVNGVGLVVCRQGSFMFTLNQKDFSAKANETLFIPVVLSFRYAVSRKMRKYLFLSTRQSRYVIL